MMFKNVSFDKVNLSEGFWRDRFVLNARASMESVRARFEESGRFDAARFIKREDGNHPHFYYDSDVAKWIEAVAWLAATDRNGYAEYEKICDGIIDAYEKNQRPDGYINSYFQQMEPDKIFSGRDLHELYCAGHLIEAAVAYHKATGKDKLLKVIERFCALIHKVFIEERSAAFTTCGHPEIELALIRLYDHTRNTRYLEMAAFFVNERGVSDRKPLDDSYTTLQDQNDRPARELVSAEGHAVRATYFYTAMSELGQRLGDDELNKAAASLFKDITDKMYITGGIGSYHRGEGFTAKYDLPNLTAYNETCAAIGLMQFCLSLQEKQPRGIYGDTIERIMYNNLLSSTSLDGKAFFYENPLEICRHEKYKHANFSPQSQPHLPIWHRQEVFTCSCCPPNINRTMASIAKVIFTEGEDCLYINQYIPSSFKKERGEVAIDTAFPSNGEIKITLKNCRYLNIKLRVPYWSKDFSISANGAALNCPVKDGYIALSVAENSVISLKLDMKPLFYSARPEVTADAGRVSLMYGPAVYCLEEADNGPDLNALSADIDIPVAAEHSAGYLPILYADGYREITGSDALYIPASDMRREPCKLKYIPYYTFANRHESDMLVWVRKSR